MSSVLHADTSLDKPNGVVQEIIDEFVLRQAIDATREGVAICDACHPETPLLYVNPAFTRMTGYPLEEVVGINCRFLQGDDTLQPEIAVIKRALRMGGGCQVILRNYRRDGKLFHNELTLSPVRNNDGQLTHYVGILKDVTRRVEAEQKLSEREQELQRLKSELDRMNRCDTVTGLLNRHTIDECLDREWRRALREKDIVNLYMIDIDQFSALNNRYGHAIGNACLRRVGEALDQCFGRASDFVGRFGDDQFIVLNVGLLDEEAASRGRFLLETIRAMSLPDPVEKLTVSIGLRTVRPVPQVPLSKVIRAAETALDAAKSAGCDRLELAAAI